MRKLDGGEHLKAEVEDIRWILKKISLTSFMYQHSLNKLLVAPSEYTGFVRWEDQDQIFI